MQPLNIQTHPAFSSLIVSKIFKRISNRAAIRMARTCKFALTQSTNHKETALNDFEKEIKKLRDIEDNLEWGRAISFDEGRYMLHCEERNRETKKRAAMSWLVGYIGENLEEKKTSEKLIQLLREYLTVLNRLARM